jgi:trk system potassium uptake protein TrkH
VKRTDTVQTVFHVLGFLIAIHGFLLLIPVIPAAFYGELALVHAFVIPSSVSFVVGFFLIKFIKPGSIRYLQSMLICGMGWIVLSVFGCIPFHLGSEMSFLDAYFETVSGITTTGITLFTNIEALPRSILFWRGFIQWIGGLGILTFFLAITFRSDNTYFRLFAAESHKIDSSRPTPGIFNTVLILWGLYTFLTMSEVIVLKLLGLSLFDAVCHSFTTLSTGGFSTYNASIDHFRRAGFANYRAIEYAITFFMFLGGVNFLLHYKVLRGRVKDVSRNIELRYFVAFILCSIVLIMVDHHRHVSPISLGTLEEDFRHTIFTVISILTTTGYGTTDINEPFFPAMSKQIFLVLMLVGGCVGSTGGGIKVLRIVILLKVFMAQIERVRLPRKAVSEAVVEYKVVPNAELKRVIGLFCGWLFLLMVGGLVSAFFTELGSWEAFSGMFSALGNIGPCYISVQQMSELHPVVKLTYMFGMLAGRLEILPVILLFSSRAWK